MTRILAIDLGKFKSVACDFDSTNNEHTFVKVTTRAQELHDLIVEHQPDLVVIEVGSQSGWVKDLCEALEVPVQVANPNHEGWRWKNVKRKTDRTDALKLAKLAATGQLPTVKLPVRRVREWRALIRYRSKLIDRRTAIKNSIRSVMDRHGLPMPARHKGWSGPTIAELKALSRPLTEVGPDDLWRGQLWIELTALEQVQQLIDQVEEKLDALGAADERVRRLRTIPGVGPRLSEMVVAVIDDPKRFKNRREVAAYAGLVPRQFESGTMSRSGHITGAGSKLLRKLLTEVAWGMQRYNPYLKSVFEQVCRGSKTRRKLAIVATARRLLIVCWAMLRNGTTWRVPTPA